MRKQCPNCKSIIKAETYFCELCGEKIIDNFSEMDVANNTDHEHEKRNPIIALILSVIYPGLGHLYCERYNDAWLFLLLSLALGGVSSLISLMSTSVSSMLFNIIMVVIGYIVLVTRIGVWGWSVYDCYVTVEKINKGEIKHIKVTASYITLSIVFAAAVCLIMLPYLIEKII